MHLWYLLLLRCSVLLIFPIVVKFGCEALRPQKLDNVVA